MIIEIQARNEYEWNQKILVMVESLSTNYGKKKVLFTMSLAKERFVVASTNPVKALTNSC